MTFLWSKKPCFFHLKHDHTRYPGVLKRKETFKENSHFCGLKSLVSNLKHHQTIYLGVWNTKTSFEENANV